MIADRNGRSRSFGELKRAGADRGGGTSFSLFIITVSKRIFLSLRGPRERRTACGNLLPASPDLTSFRPYAWRNTHTRMHFHQLSCEQ